jgi:quercetin dioxygenase-like cupin family protein
MWKTTCLALLTCFVILAVSTPVTADSCGSASAENPDSHDKPGAKLENLLRAQLEAVGGTEVIVSRVAIPPHSSLPKHWHPGEEFGYVLEGSVILWQEGKDDIVVEAGDVVRIPLRQVHTAITTEEGATVLVFRVHEEGQPERVAAE